MPEMFKIGDRITSNKGIQYTVSRFIGSGGQGEVYEVDSSNGKMALNLLKLQEIIQGI